MDVAEAQKEMRDVYLNTGPGSAVSALVWFVSAACATWVSQRLGALTLLIGGMFIFPLTQVSLFLMKRPISVRPSNPLRHLAPQVAFIVPITMPLAGVAMMQRASWFYPAFMVIVGAHYLPFAFLYGLRRFLVLAVILIVGGFGLAFSDLQSYSIGAWFTAVVLAAFAAFTLSRRERVAIDGA